MSSNNAKKAQYEHYKDSGIEWIGDIPEHWVITKVKYLANPNSDFSFIDGDWVESKYITDDGIRLIQTGNVGVGRFKDQGSKYITEETFQELNCKEVYPGDILISRLSPPVARGCLAPNLPTKMITSVDNVILRPKNSIDSRFIVYFFSTRNYLEYVDILARGATMSRISRTILSNNPVILPTYEEQTAIANYLDEKTGQIDRLIDIAQKKIERLQEYRTALINQVVTKGLDPNVPMKDSGIEWIGEIPEHWDIYSLKYFVEIDPEKLPENSNPELEFNYVEISDVEAYTGDFSSRKVTFKTSPSRARKIIRKGDVFISTVRTYLRALGFVQNNKQEYMVCSTGFCVLRAKSMDPCFLYYFTLSESFINRVVANSEGVSYPAITPSKLTSLKICIPSKKEQDQIGKYLDNKTGLIDQDIQEEQNRIQKLQEYRQTLISEVVTGKKKVVNNEAYEPA